MFLYKCEGEMKNFVWKEVFLMIKAVMNFFETILVGLYELAPVYVTVESREYNNKH